MTFSGALAKVRMVTTLERAVLGAALWRTVTKVRRISIFMTLLDIATSLDSRIVTLFLYFIHLDSGCKSLVESTETTSAMAFECNNQEVVRDTQVLSVHNGFGVLSIRFFS